MSIFPDWIGIDIESGGTTVVESVTLEVVDGNIQVDLREPPVLEVLNEQVEIEVT